MFRPLLLFVFCLSTNMVVAADPAIVRGKVTKIGKKVLRHTSYSVQIQHVYRGDADLKGKVFEDLWMEFGAGHSGGSEYVTSVPVEVGEEGLWLLNERDSVLTPTRAEDGLRLPPMRHRKADRPGYEVSLKLAETVEKYTQLKPDEQLAMVEKLAYDSEPYIGYWGVYVVGKMPGRAAEDAFARLRDDAKLPVRSQIAVDEVLCRVKDKKDEWFKSKQQLKMYETWVTSKADEDPGDYILGRFGLAVQERGNIDPSKAVELCMTAADNTKWTTAVRTKAIRWVNMHACKMNDQDKPFQWLAEVVRTNPMAELRRVAAAHLDGLPKVRDRDDTLRSLLADEKDEQVIRHLKAALGLLNDKK